MKRISITVMILGLSFILGGCMGVDKTKEVEGKQADDVNATEDTRKNEYEKENFVPIQEYTGEGFKLRDSRKETLEIAEKHRDEVENAVKDFFLEKYKTEVNVHNMVAAKDGVTVYVESIGEPHFYTFAIVPVDIKDEVVRTDSVWSLEGKVENGITGGLYAMAYEEEFTNLDQYLQETVENYPIVGTPSEAIENVMATGYTTPYYFVVTAGDVFEQLFSEYMQNPDITAKEVKDFLAKNPFDPGHMIFGIEFYMEERNTEPEQDILDSIASDIERLEDIPRGSYYIHLNDNYIDKRRGIGQKDNSIKRSGPNAITKE